MQMCLAISSAPGNANRTRAMEILYTPAQSGRSQLQTEALVWIYFQMSVISAASLSFSVSGSSPKFSSIVRSRL